MRKKMLFCMMMILAVGIAPVAMGNSWSPMADPNRPAGEPALWSVAQNWSDGAVPNSADAGVDIARANTPCLLDMGETYQINQLKLGEFNDNNGRLIVKGILNTSNNWQGIGAWGASVGVLEIDGGQFNTFDGGHIWCGSTGNGTIIVKNGGELNVGVQTDPEGNPNGTGAQLGLGWDTNATSQQGYARIYIEDGLVTVNNWTNQSVNPLADASIDISNGTFSIGGYRISPGWGDAGAVDKMAQEGRITGFADADFDKKLNIDNEGTDNQNDIINNVLLQWDGARTIVTAVHPQQPAPYFNDVVVAGDIELGWNNWDPNDVGDAVSVELYVSTDPNGANYLSPVFTADATGQARTTTTINIPTPAPGEEVTYYWQVKTDNGVDEVHQGDLFWFTAVGYKAFKVTGAQSVITTMDLLPANISATVTTYGTPLTSAEYTLLSDDLEFPAGANAVLTPDVSDLLHPTATLDTDMAGTYKVKLVVEDGTTTIEKLIEVDVYADACQAKKDSPSGWVANYYDTNSDCFVNISDLVPFAAAWLNDTTMKAQETEAKDVLFIPQSAFDNRIEAESVDPDAVSDAPVTDETGIRIVNEGGATGGGQALGWAGNGVWAEYEITVPETGVYDVYFSIASPQATNVLSFGDGTTVNLYGTISVGTSGVWGTYVIGVDKGALTLPAGTYTVRITWTNANANLDWFTLVKQ